MATMPSSLKYNDMARYVPKFRGVIPSFAKVEDAKPLNFKPSFDFF